MTAKQVVIAGTFDILHPGHVFLISEAAKLGEVTVVIAQDENVLRAKAHPVIVPAKQRLDWHELTPKWLLILAAMDEQRKTIRSTKPQQRVESTSY